MKHLRFFALLLAIALLVGLGRVLWHPLRLDRFGRAQIEWQDLVHIDGRTYYADTYVSKDNTVEISTMSAEAVGEKLGSVRFTMEGKVKNPEYRLHNGDASYLPKGTEIYAVLDSTNTVAVEVEGVYYRYTI
ncbi:MAG: hypothetical protein IJC58_05715 [Oscillospiraceae bacterium]|nr:hypothetical protein [Oscillospiraceae bacterium]